MDDSVLKYIEQSRRAMYSDHSVNESLLKRMDVPSFENFEERLQKGIDPATQEVLERLGR